MALVHPEFRVLTAVTGGEGQDLAISEAPDLIILDPELPDVDGFELCQRLRAHALTARVPIVIVTRREAMRDKLAGFRAGADDYLSRPLDPRELVARVRAILRRTSRCRPSDSHEGAGSNQTVTGSAREPYTASPALVC